MAFDLGKEISTQIKTRVFKKVVGGVGDSIRGIPGIGNSSQLGKLATREKAQRGVDNYSFPIDVESGTEMGNHGHYIMFYINEQEHAKIRFGDRHSSGRGSVIEEVRRRKIPDYIRKATTGQAVLPVEISTDDAGPVGEEARRIENASEYELVRQEAENNLIDGLEFDDSDLGRALEAQIRDQMRTTQKGQSDSTGYKRTVDEKTYNGINVKRAPTKRLKTAISMYMPPDITSSYSAGYSDATIGLFTEQAQDILKDLSGAIKASGQERTRLLAKGFTKVSDEIFGGGIEAMLTQMLLSTADAIPGLGSSGAVFGMRQGKVFSPRMEVAFQGLEKRKFNYTFKMTPRSSREAEEIRAIIYAFKHNMLPEVDGDFTAGRRMIVPNTFDISYMYNGSENEFLHKISTCVLENLEVKYGGGGKYQTFAGGENGAPVVETTISLSFKEIETITRERAQEGF